MSATGDADAAVLPPESFARKRRWQPAAVLWGVALIAVIAVWSLDPRVIEPYLLIGPVDADGVQYLSYLTTAALLAAALFATAYGIGGPLVSVSRKVIASVITSGLVLVLLLLALPAFLLGALVFSSDYRRIGTVDRRELIVERRVGLGQFPIEAGLRHGWSVDFSASTGDTWTDGGAALSAMRFAVRDNGDTVTITYRPGPRPEQPAGTLLVTK